jgi:hypothetical protein
MMTLPYGNSIDLGMLETAMADSDVAHRYCLNLVSGEVLFFSDHLCLSNGDERSSEEIDGSNDYVATQRFSSYEAYQWMIDFVDDMVAPVDKRAAEMLAVS